MDRNRPQPMTVGDEYLAHVLDELEGVREVLGQIRDRLPEPARAAADDGPRTVELREPEPVKPAKNTAPAKTTRRTLKG